MTQFLMLIWIFHISIFLELYEFLYKSGLSVLKAESGSALKTY